MQVKQVIKNILSKNNISLIAVLKELGTNYNYNTVKRYYYEIKKELKGIP